MFFGNGLEVHSGQGHEHGGFAVFHPGDPSSGHDADDSLIIADAWIVRHACCANCLIKLEPLIDNPVSDLLGKFKGGAETCIQQSPLEDGAGGQIHVPGLGQWNGNDSGFKTDAHIPVDESLFGTILGAADGFLKSARLIGNAGICFDGPNCGSCEAGYGLENLLNGLEFDRIFGAEDNFHVVFLTDGFPKGRQNVGNNLFTRCY